MYVFRAQDVLYELIVLLLSLSVGPVELSAQQGPRGPPVRGHDLL